MAVFLQSPGVQVIEKDASVVTPGASSSVGGYVGTFQWGPVMTPMLISDESNLVSIFGKPDDATFGSFFSSTNFLSYANALWVTRAATVNKNATANGAGLLIKNVFDYEAGYSIGQGSVGTFAARYPGTLGNSILVSIADSATFSTWAYKDQFQSAPGTSDFVASKGGLNDELHIIVIDAGGKFTGTPGATLEKYSYVSKASDAISYQGLSNYYTNVIRNQSQYVYWMDHAVGGTNWGTSAINTTFTQLVDTVTDGYDFTYALSGGTDQNTALNAELELGWDLYKNIETYDISLFFVGNANTALSKYVVDNIAEVRKDGVVFISLVAPAGGPVFSTSSTAVADSATFKTAIGNSNYTVIDSGYKYLYDKYNDKYRWVALNSDIAGLCAKVDANQDSWISPAGLTKGQIRGAIKLSWNPTQAQRDELYKLAINPVVSFAGQGTILYGDKTATLKPSAFDRINVRRLFLALEKSISRSAKYQLFEQNDAITRLQFVASVEPFLRDVQGRRGIDAFKVICDASNNTPQVVSTNEFRGTILVRPLYSINYLTLTFTAVGGSVSFDTAAQV
jgi:Phage tail sheath protein subtilisin-like domain/Phage tail sheath C-terminal domain